MNDFQVNKKLVKNFYDDLDAASGSELESVINSYTSEDYLWRGMHPFYEQQGSQRLPKRSGSLSEPP
jgi:hypothetical protein